MEKIFLSHSSSDKDYVRPIFEYFGGDRCIFDEMERLQTVQSHQRTSRDRR